MRGGRPGIKNEFNYLAHSQLRGGGMLDIEICGDVVVDMFCLGSIYTVTTRQVYLSPDLGTISLMEILPPCLSASLPHLKHQSSYFLTLDNFKSDLAGWG